VSAGILATVVIVTSQVGSIGAAAPVPLAPRAVVITSQPRSVTVVAGARVNFAAAARGNPTPTIEWQVSTNNGRSWKRIRGASGFVYSIVSSLSRRGNDFRAVFTNAVNSTATHLARLNVKESPLHLTATPARALAIASNQNRRIASPTITSQPASVTVTTDSTATFKAAASGTPAPKVMWQVSVNQGRTWNRVVGATSANYSLVATVSQGGNEFRAVFTNSAGSATTDRATLSVNATVTTTTVPPPTTTVPPPAKTTMTTSPPPPATTTTTTSPPRPATTTTTVPSPTTSGVITTGDSRANCIYIDAVDGVFTTAELASVENATGVDYNCVEIFADADPTWSDWVNPWPTRVVSDGWDAWLAADPSHQLVLGLQLIPDSECTSVCVDPLVWESACATGAYNSYATELAQNLVSEGAGNSVIRLGKEFNGSWENDYFGDTTAEYQAWAQCFAQEVTAMRAVPGAHFLFDWNPNTCTGDFPLADAYPGNAYVDIIGADFYDADCATGETSAQEGWNSLFLIPSVQTSLSDIAAFAKAQGKPLSIPEWGEITTTDDITYMNGVIGVVENNDVAYQSYFDCDCDGITPLGPTIPASTAAYQQAFS